MTNYSQETEVAISELLVGHRIVSAEIGSFDAPDETASWYQNARGRMTLDDGRQVYVFPNEGGCSCGAGDYDLTRLVTVDNVITSVRLENKPGGDDEDSYDGTYRIFVVADAVEINAVQIDGSDGNGYYGTGYSLTVVPAADES